MAANGNDSPHRRAVIGNEKNFWLYDSSKGFDLTHPPTPTSPPVSPSMTIKTSTSPITADPAKSALVIIDMQQFFLSPAFGRSQGPGHEILNQLIMHAIPAAREAEMRVIWLNWGLTDHDIKTMPPAVTRAFGFEAEVDGRAVALDKYGEIRYQGGDQRLEDGRPGKKYKGLGSECGMMHDPYSGKTLDAGRLLMRDQWNSNLVPSLDHAYKVGKTLPTRPDVLIHKNRMSGMAGQDSDCARVLQQEGIRTLFFAGVNTDQCVGGTYQDAFNAGYDCVLLRDGCGTTSPKFAQDCIEFNAANTWGFTTSCEEFAEGAEAMRS